MIFKDFYPTPITVIEQMCFGLNLKDKFALEPSAGKGDIVDYLKQQGANVIGCELNNDLATIVNSKVDRFLKNDFLDVTIEEISHVNFIVMNPPFSADEKHIIHAYKIAPDGCTIVSLCNSETLKNNYSFNRKELISLIENFGTSEFLGNVFSDSERETDVGVSLIKLFKPKKEGENEFEDYFDLSEEYENQENGIIQYSEIRDIINRYIGAVKKFNSVIEASKEINNLISPINNLDKIKFGAFQNRNGRDYCIDREEFKKELQKLAWKTIFSKMNMSKYVTQSVMSDINKFVEQQTKIPFTLSNVYKMVELIAGTHGNRMNKVLEEAFDTICSYSYENSTGGEGWKTNSNYKINQRFIKPWCTEVGWGGQLKVRNRSSDNVMDIVKALCYITGVNYSNITNLDSFAESLKMEWGEWHEWGFFKVRGYKKGTMHFEFTDLKVWENFNRTVAKIKGWKLPEQTDTKQKGTERTKTNKIVVI